MNHSLLSLDSHFLFFDEAEKESFDIDTFLSPTYDIALPVMEGPETVLNTPFSSPNKLNDNSVNGQNFFNSDENILRPKKSEMNNYIKDLEQRIAELLNENSKLKENVYSLSSDKQRLENEILLMQELMRGMSPEKVESNKDDLNLPVMSSNNLLGLKPHPQASTRVLLLVLLLSFGLLFHQTVTSDSIDIGSTNRTLSDLTLTSPKIEQKDKNLVPQPLNKVERQNSGVTQKAAKRVLKHEKSSSTRSVKRRKETVKQQQKQQQKQLPPTPIVPIPFPSTISTPTSSNHRSLIPEIIQWRPHTTYLICNNVSQIVPPPSVEQRQSSQPSMVSLLIPPDALGTSQENALLEVTCQVMDVNFVPLR